MSQRNCTTCGTEWSNEVDFCPHDGAVLRDPDGAQRPRQVNTWAFYERPTSGPAAYDLYFDTPTDELPALSFSLTNGSAPQPAAPSPNSLADTRPAPRVVPSDLDRDDTDGRVFVQMKVRRNAAFSDTDWFDRPQAPKSL